MYMYNDKDNTNNILNSCPQIFFYLSFGEDIQESAL